MHHFTGLRKIGCALVILAIGFMMTESQMSAQATTTSSGSFDFNTDGLVFATTDTSSRVVMRFRMQNWATVNMNESMDIISSDLVVRRLRLRLGGHIVDKRLTFNLQLNFGRADLDAADQPIPNIIRDAMVFWNFSKQLQVGFGQTKLPGNRQRVISSGDQFFPDRSIVNGAFNLDRDFGLQGFWRPIDSDVIVNLRASLSSGDGRNQGTIAGNGFAYTGRVELLPMGSFKDGGDYTEGDLAREATPKLSIGGTYQFNDLTTRTRGALGPVLFSPRSTNIIYADAVLKWEGFSLYGEYAQRTCDDPVTRSATDSTKRAAVLVGNGFLAQAMYVTPTMWGFGARYATTRGDDALAGLSEHRKDENLAAVAAYFINKHRVKVQTELGMNQVTPLATEDATATRTFYARLNLEFGI